MAKISKKTRDLALEGLDLAANNFDGDPRFNGFSNLAGWLDVLTPAYDLAYDASVAVPGTGQDMLLEAAALLRTGWRPGQTVPLR
jgi:hypothetical protein